MKAILTLFLAAYRRYFSPCLPRSCRFHPSCSAYAFEAVNRHGARAGSWLALRRLVRCHPFCRGGLDPVPAPGRPDQPPRPANCGQAAHL